MDWKVAGAGGGRPRTKDDANQIEKKNKTPISTPLTLTRRRVPPSPARAPRHPPAPPIAPSEDVLSPSYSYDACAARKGIGPGPGGGASYVLVLVLPLPMDDA
ncbi:hypothetical protein B0H11DRAFT_2223872 [Mycena galericulata]|nr:hypothetical protein B0H11DRAFT_2223872 [Mycena galericulata]